jgi:hypothetical protein
MFALDADVRQSGEGFGIRWAGLTMNRKPGGNTSAILLRDEAANFCSRCGTALPTGTDSAFCSAHGGPPLAPDATIRCPFCSERILASAKKCKHCGEFLDERNTTNARVAAPPRVHKSGDTICPNPNCHYEGPPRKVARGSVLVGIVLLFFFLLPGILYLIFMQGYRYYCPKCGLQIRSEN